MVLTFCLRVRSDALPEILGSWPWCCSMELITQSRELLELGLLFGNSVGNQILVGSPGVCGRLFDQLAQIAPQESDALVDFRDGQRPICHFVISAVCTSLLGSLRSARRQAR